jgi:hypothetical protein
MAQPFLTIQTLMIWLDFWMVVTLEERLDFLWLSQASLSLLLLFLGKSPI